MAIKAWSAADIKRGTVVKYANGGRAIVMQASWNDGDDLDQFILVSELRRVFKPEIHNAAQMAILLNKGGYVAVRHD